MSTERELACEEYLDSLRGQMGVGQLALEAVQLYRASDLPVPEWALSEISARYFLFKVGAPSAGWTKDQVGLKAPKSLGEAFEVPDHKDGAKANAKRMRAVLLPQVRAVFEGPDALPKNDVNYEATALRLGVTVDQVRRMALTKRE